MNERRTTPRTLWAALVAAPLLAGPLVTPALAQSPRPTPPAPPVTPGPGTAAPVLTVAPGWVFRVGEQVDRAAPVRANPYDLSAYHLSVPVQVVWSARSAVGIDHYDLYRFGAHSPAGGTPLLVGTRLTRYATTTTDVHAAVGPINQTLYSSYTVVATDRRGRSTASADNRRGPVHYEQENGTTVAGGSGPGGLFRRPVAGPGWRTVKGSQFDGGTVLSSARRGSVVRIPLVPTRTQEVALEMTTGPALGAVEVRVDGRRVGVVDTWSRTWRPRVLVAQYRLTAGPHTVTLVNLGVRHRSTVQLDGVFVSD